MNVSIPKFLRSIYFRFNVFFVAVLVLMAVVLLTLVGIFGNLYFAAADQSIGWEMAKNLKPQIEQLVAKEINAEALDKFTKEVNKINPRVELYLLNEQGEVLYPLSSTKIKPKQIDLSQIQEFLDVTKLDFLPVLGTDPFRDRWRTVFSVAPITLQQGQGYLYINLVSKEYRDALNLLRNYYRQRIFNPSIVLAIILTLLFSLLLFYFLTRRFRRIVEVVQKISNEDFSDRIEDSSKDELGDITRALNLMSERIANSVEKLKEKDLLRGTMLRSLAHDLRTPLTSIRGFNELLHLQGPQLPAQDREDYYQLIFSRVDMIDNMVQGLHLLSRLEAEDAKPDLLPLSVKELFERLERSYQLTSSDHSIKISFTLNHGVEGVVADQFMLERVLNNLIDNAIRHTAKNGQIEVSATPVGNLVEFTVKDSGCGIAEDEIELIFEQFYRATNSQKSTTAGTGLGLYIVKRILALHNSLIKVKSALGKGTSFSFSLDGYSAKTI